MIGGHCARSDFSPFLLPFQRSVLQNTHHVACQYAHTVLYWSLSHNCGENQNDCITLLAVQAQCAELLKGNTCMVNGDITPLILNLGTRWKQVVSICPQKFTPGMKGCCAMTGASQPTWTFWKTEKPLTLTEVQTTDHPARSIVSIQHTLSRIPKY